jgi:hypothetical protein
MQSFCGSREELVCCARSLRGRRRVDRQDAQARSWARPILPVAQRIERRASNAKAGSSILSGRTNQDVETRDVVEVTFMSQTAAISFTTSNTQNTTINETVAVSSLLARVSMKFH